ncbi:hypothetical protein DY000_02020504 [Brassica cretica]|uniref:Uncharacterized protein n=1 Tax=Brassica cretica TaxID=69181 RepID=A0ABQ7E776_BRACR|nr:hypothetical protein DY000_02020504 [Brassica cretica]
MLSDSVDLLNSGNSFGTLETSRRTVNSWESLYFSLMKRERASLNGEAAAESIDVDKRA